MTIKHLTGDCGELLKEIPDASVSVVITSPPYADARSSTYGGIHPDRYVEWFLPKVAQLKRVLRSDGTFILNIKERVVKGVRHRYVIDLILALGEQGWLWTEEWMWCKKNCAPGKWPNRFRDSWERLLQFNLNRNFAMYQDEVMVPVGEWAKTRLARLSKTDKTRDASASGSNFGKNVSNWVGRDKVYPTNVLHLPTECGNTGHSAAFPVVLPEFYIKLFSKVNEVVLDPFAGSGSTGIAAAKLGRGYIGMDIVPEYAKLFDSRLKKLGLTP